MPVATCYALFLLRNIHFCACCTCGAALPCDSDADGEATYQALQRGRQILQVLGQGPEVSHPAAPCAAQDPRCCINKVRYKSCLACMPIAVLPKLAAKELSQPQQSCMQRMVTMFAPAWPDSRHYALGASERDQCAHLL